MVLQQDKPLLFWGWSDPNETITLTLGAETKQAQANARGEWRVTLPARKAGSPLTLKIRGSSEVVFEDVLIGEVWLASGQSNMEMGLGMCRNGKDEVAAANHPSIRLFMVRNRWMPEPQIDLESARGPEGVWKVCSPQTVGEGGWKRFFPAPPIISVGNCSGSCRCRWD